MYNNTGVRTVGIEECFVQSFDTCERIYFDGEIIMYYLVYFVQARYAYT